MKIGRGYSSAGRAPALQAGGRRTTDNRKVGGSSPLGPTNLSKLGNKYSKRIEYLFLVLVKAGDCTLKTEQCIKVMKARQQRGLSRRLERKKVDFNCGQHLER